MRELRAEGRQHCEDPPSGRASQRSDGPWRASPPPRPPQERPARTTSTHIMRSARASAPGEKGFESIVWFLSVSPRTSAKILTSSSTMAADCTQRVSLRNGREMRMERRWQRLKERIRERTKMLRTDTALDNHALFGKWPHLSIGLNAVLLGKSLKRRTSQPQSLSKRAEHFECIHPT